MLYPLCLKGLLLLVLVSLPLPPLFSCSLKKASRAYKYAPLPPGAKFLPPIPFPPPPADRPPLAPPRRAIAHLPLPSLRRAIPERGATHRRFPTTDGRLAPSPALPIGSRAPRGNDLRIPCISPGISSLRFARASSIAFGWARRYLSTWAPAMHARVVGVRGKELDSRERAI